MIQKFLKDNLAYLFSLIIFGAILLYSFSHLKSWQAILVSFVSSFLFMIISIIICARKKYKTLKMLAYTMFGLGALFAIQVYSIGWSNFELFLKMVF